ncbi:hypothetical protein BS47DRAFT_1388434 [Hydnum rufescens UP504]|uniref:DUF6534 domain-containing protein n=1 Tax=Hydnum rufescens UP504 TaxID=1448309 RepID=A0A9P6B7L8_9AGAM|nr:hypothetical protein BS47DRAFT_1388434 [Hydnum rufescens UP504]
MGIMTGPLLNLFGGAFFGEVLTTICFGILTVQISSYYRTFPNDGRRLKVAGIRNVSSQRGEPRVGACRRCPDLDFGTIYPKVGASVTVQTFFAHRVYSLSSNLYLGIFVEAFVFLQFVPSHTSIVTYCVPISNRYAATAIKANIILEPQLVVKECTWLIVTWLAFQAVSDVAIATCMCILLRRRRTGFQRTDSIINRMVLYTIGTGSLTGVLSCIILGLFATYGFEFSVLILTMPLSALYSITMLANLHARRTLQTKLTQTTPLQVMNSIAKHRKPPSTVVHVTKETTVHDEMGSRLTVRIR